MKIIPTQLVVEECIFECSKQEIHTIIRALHTQRVSLLKIQENEKDKNKVVRAEVELGNIEVLEKAFHSYYRIPIVTEKNWGDID